MHDLVQVESCSCHNMNLLKQPKEEVQESLGASNMFADSTDSASSNSPHTRYVGRLVLRMPRDGLMTPYW